MTRDVGRSVNTLNELVVEEEAKQLLETPFLVATGALVVLAMAAASVKGCTVSVSFASSAAATAVIVVPSFASDGVCSGDVLLFSFATTDVLAAVSVGSTVGESVLLLAAASRIWRIRSSSAGVYPPSAMEHSPPGVWRTREVVRPGWTK